jgi:hypothetical protein
MQRGIRRLVQGRVELGCKVASEQLYVRKVQRNLNITENPRPTRGIRSSKAVGSVNPRWTNLVLYGIDGDTGTRPWKVKVNEQNVINIL